jgi:hypothetical protein
VAAASTVFAGSGVPSRRAAPSGRGYNINAIPKAKPSASAFGFGARREGGNEKAESSLNRGGAASEEKENENENENEARPSQANGGKWYTRRQRRHKRRSPK